MEDSINPHTRKFTMVEVIVALAVITAVLVSVMTPIPSAMRFNRGASNQQAMILLDGHPAPNIDGYGSQPDLAEFIKGYVDATTGKVTLAPNEAIVRFEFGTTHVSSGDFQDLVVLVTPTPAE